MYHKRTFKIQKKMKLKERAALSCFYIHYYFLLLLYRSYIHDETVFCSNNDKNIKCLTLFSSSCRVERERMQWMNRKSSSSNTSQINLHLPFHLSTHYEFNEFLILYIYDKMPVLHSYRKIVSLTLLERNESDIVEERLRVSQNLNHFNDYFILVLPKSHHWYIFRVINVKVSGFQFFLCV